MSISRSRLTVDHCFGSVILLLSYVAMFVLRFKSCCGAVYMRVRVCFDRHLFRSLISHSTFLRYRSHILTFILFSFIINDNLQKLIYGERGQTAFNESREHSHTHILTCVVLSMQWHSVERTSI